jgi:hypothetical protein
MTCEEVGPFLPVLEDGSLGEMERQGVQAHLDSCLRCRAALGRLGRLEGLLGRAASVPDPGAEFWVLQKRKILGDVQARNPAGQAILRRSFRILWTAAAAVMLLALGAFLGRRFSLPAPGRVESASRPAAGDSRESSPPEISRPAPVVSEGTARPGVSEGPGVPPDPSPPLAAVVLPGSPEHLAQLTDELIDIGLAETPTDRVRALCQAAGARLRELRQVMERDPALATELAGAYIVLLGEGVKSVLRDGAETPASLAAAREVAALEARSHGTLLATLGGTATGKLKETLDEALATSRELAKP